MGREILRTIKYVNSVIYSDILIRDNSRNTVLNFNSNRNHSNQQLLVPLSSFDNDGNIDIDENKNTTISFERINYTLKANNSILSRLSPCKLTPARQILFDISGVFRSGMNAILGPTGCGKSTLLDILADRKDRQTYEGEILINRRARPPSSVYRHTAAYVVQDDIFSGTLSVRENIVFSANLRLPLSMSYAERLKRVERIIQQLHLTECADTRMGTESQRGVSGGERKRTCIAMEMVLEPKILFLDEPTTGKDIQKRSQFISFH